MASALRLFARDGYAAASVDRIAEDAGFSKGAFYSNFDGKEQIYLEVLESYGEANLARLLKAVDQAETPEQVIDAVAGWATRTARSGNWGLLVLEYARSTRHGADVQAKQEAIFRAHWQVLGERLVVRLNLSGRDPGVLGALVFELTYAPAMSFVESPSAGDLVSLALRAIFKEAS
ncbi:MAG TPA: TetR/AcrR family transcriptional regulator [Candidatus Sulfotelmatobacter sp.]|nr:TetR/AcrR family transcriptional regulator [Candidatus Sulfotelmatobacter sp.]